MAAKTMEDLVSLLKEEVLFFRQMKYTVAFRDFLITALWEWN